MNNLPLNPGDYFPRRARVNDFYVGDFPEDHNRMRPLGVWPTQQPTLVGGVIGGVINHPPVPLSKWRSKRDVSGTLITSIDVPGVGYDSLKVEIRNRTLYVCGTRADSGSTVSEEQFLGFDCDPTTAQAVLENGVLTVTVFKLNKDEVYRVDVKKVP